MVYSNPYFRSSKLSEVKFCSILECFAKDLTATCTAELTGVSVRSVNTIFLRIRQRSAECCEALNPWRQSGHAQAAPDHPGLVERSSGGKNIVLGLLNRCGKIYTEIVPQPMKTMLQALIRGQLTLQSVMIAGNWRGYDGLVDLEFERFLRVNQGGHGSIDSCQDGIEAFWNFTESRLRKFYGLPGRTFWLHLKECEFRYNHREQDLFSVVENLLRQNPL